MNQNFQALSDAVRERRRELGMTQPDLSERSRRLDLEFFPDTTHKKRGLSVRTWSEIERAIEKERRGRTQFLVDATLKWPRGTAHALLYGQALPSGPPPTSDGRRVETAKVRAEVAELRVELTELSERVAQFAC